MFHRKVLPVVFGLCSLVAAEVPSLAEARRLGAEQAVSLSAVRQRNPAASLRQDGSGWVVWENLAQGLVGRRLSKEGEAVGSEVLLVANRNLSGIPAQGIVLWQKEPAIAALPDGRFLLVWTRERVALRVDHFWEDREVLDRFVFAQYFGASGRAVGRPSRVDPAAKASQGSPRVALGSGGGAAVVWQQALSPAERLDQGELRGRFLDLAGGFASDTFLVAAAPSGYPALAVDEDGVLWAAWQGPDGSGDGVFARRFRANGRALAPPVRVNDAVEGCQRRAAFAPRAGAGFWVFFHGPAADPGENLIFARRLAADGAPVGAQRAVSPGAHEDEVYPAAARLGDGSYLVVWMSWWKNFPQGYFAQELRDDGGLEAVGEAVRLNEFRAYTQFRTAIAASPGRVLGVWESLAPKQRKAGVSVQQIGAGD